MLVKTFIIGKNTFTETIRQPVYAVIIIAALFLFVLSPYITMYTMDEDIKLLREIGLSTLFLAGLFISVFSAAAAVTEEIETKTITTVLSKPISRSTFIIGKFLGVSAAVLVAHYICTIAMLMAVRHGVLETVNDTVDWPVVAAAAAAFFGTIIITAFLNYIYDWNFPATAIKLGTLATTFAIIFLVFVDKEWQLNPAKNNIALFDIYGSVLLLLAVVIIIALAVMFSTRFNIVLTLIFCVGIFLLGLINDWIFGRLAHKYLWAKVCSIIVPNFQVFWISDAIHEGSNIPTAYVFMSASYAIFYTIAILFLATALFQRRQIG